MATLDAAIITIVGCGPGGADFITLAGMRAIESATVVIGARRLLDTFGGSAAEQIAVGVDIEAALDAIAQHSNNCDGVVVLVSGDPGISSLAQPVLRRFGHERCRLIPGISSVQVAFARLGLDWLDARLITAHGRTPTLTAADLAHCAKIAVLAGSPQAMQWAAALAEALPRHQAYLCHDLTLATESVQAIRADALKTTPASGRILILYINEESK